MARYMCNEKRFRKGLCVPTRQTSWYTPPNATEKATGITPFCVPGDHAVEKGKAWEPVPATVQHGKWVRTTRSTTKVVVCEDHTL